MIGARNAALIEAAAGVLAVLDGTDVDSGTAAEIGFAAALARPVVGVRLDLRQTGDNEAAVVNLQVEWFIRSSGGDVTRDLADAIARLARLVGAAVDLRPDPVRGQSRMLRNSTASCAGLNVWETPAGT